MDGEKVSASYEPVSGVEGSTCAETDAHKRAKTNESTTRGA